MSEEYLTQRQRVLASVSLAVVVLAAIAVRALVQFGTSLMPGMNGAYYLVQVRAVIEKGCLAEHDMPLIFWLHAGLARLVQAVSRLTLESSIVLASKLFDSIVPVLAAIPAFLLAIGGGAVSAAGLLSVLMVLGDSARITRLVTFLAAPLSLFRSSSIGGSMRASIWLHLQDPQTFILSLVLSLAAVAVLIWRRHDVQPWERALVVASAVLALFLSSPFLNQDMASRFQLMAFAPAVILVAFLAARSGNLTLRSVLIIGTIAVVLATVPATVQSPNRPSIEEASYTELASLQTSITDPSHTLIIARHGLEWWAAWALHTDVAQPTAVTDTDWTTYASVLYLQETGNSIGAGMGAPGMTLRPQLPVSSRRPRQIPAGIPPVRPGFTLGTTPPQRGGPGGMTQPSDASTVHSGTYFTFSSLPTPVTALGNPGAALQRHTEARHGYVHQRDRAEATGSPLSGRRRGQRQRRPDRLSQTNAVRRAGRGGLCAPDTSPARARPGTTG